VEAGRCALKCVLAPLPLIGIRKEHHLGGCQRSERHDHMGNCVVVAAERGTTKEKEDEKDENLKGTWPCRHLRDVLSPNSHKVHAFTFPAPLMRLRHTNSARFPPHTPNPVSATSVAPVPHIALFCLLHCGTARLQLLHLKVPPRDSGVSDWTC
jgi:hypothetical protein